MLHGQWLHSRVINKAPPWSSYTGIVVGHVLKIPKACICFRLCLQLFKLLRTWQDLVFFPSFFLLFFILFVVHVLNFIGLSMLYKRIIKIV